MPELPEPKKTGHSKTSFQPEMDANESLKSLFYSLVKRKNSKLRKMNSVMKYMDPSDDSISDRHNRGEYLTGIIEDDILFDTTARSVISEYSITSLSDIVNPVSPWFSLFIKNQKAYAKDIQKEIETWAKESQEAFFTYITNNSYYKKIIQDKFFYDLYGFTGMSFIKKRIKQIKIHVEDPFKLYFDDYDTYFWVRKYKSHELRKIFNYIPENNENTKTHSVLCAFTPNEPEFVDSRVKKHKKYVQSYYYLENYLGSEMADTSDKTKEDYQGEFIEIGERKYFNSPFTVITVDADMDHNGYGIGLGKKMLVNAKNLNQVKENTLYSMSLISNPPMELPYDMYSEYEDIRPGGRYPASYTGQNIKPVEIPIRFNDHVNYLAVETDALRKEAPSFAPQEKRARQSQFEVDQNMLEAQKKNLIYKILYLTDGVSKHLQKMFEIAWSQGIFRKLNIQGADLKMEDVKPNISNILLKEYKRLTAISYVQALSHSQGYIALYQEGIDNVDIDEIIRNIYIAFGAEGVLLVKDKVEEIRTQRQQAQQAQQAALQQQQAAQTQLLSAQAQAASAQGQKDTSEIESGLGI